MAKKEHQAYQNATQGAGSPASAGGGGYAGTPQPGSPVYTEAWALIEAARRIAEAIGAISENNDLKTRNLLREALQTNWRLWTIFQAELTLENSEVTGDMRANMLTLCKFVDEHSVVCLQELDPEKIMALININRNIASGLLDFAEQEPAGEQPAEPGAPAAPSKRSAVPDGYSSTPAAPANEPANKSADDTPPAPPTSIDETA